MKRPNGLGVTIALLTAGLTLGAMTACGDDNTNNENVGGSGGASGKSGNNTFINNGQAGDTLISPGEGGNNPGGAGNAGAGGGNPLPPVETMVRVAHFAPSAAALHLCTRPAGVGNYVSLTTKAVSAGVAYEKVTGYTPIVSGSYDLKLVAASATCADAGLVTATAQTLAPNASITTLVVPNQAGTGVQVVLLKDNLTTTTNGVQVRLVHASQGTANVDVGFYQGLTAATPSATGLFVKPFANVAFPGVATTAGAGVALTDGYVTTPSASLPGGFPFEVRFAARGDYVGTFALPDGDANTIASGSIVTVFAYGGGANVKVVAALDSAPVANGLTPTVTLVTPVSGSNKLATPAAVRFTNFLADKANASISYCIKPTTSPWLAGTGQIVVPALVYSTVTVKQKIYADTYDVKAVLSGVANCAEGGVKAKTLAPLTTTSNETIAALGVANPPDGSPLAAVDLRGFANTDTTSATDTATVRFVHTLVGIAKLDGGRALGGSFSPSTASWSNILFGTAGSYTKLSFGVASQFAINYQSTAEADLVSAVFDTAAPQDQGVYTLWSIGSLNGAQQPAAILVCPESIAPAADAKTLACTSFSLSSLL